MFPFCSYQRNPTPGIIINKPNGTNVYDGVIIDYKGKVIYTIICTQLHYKCVDSTFLQKNLHLCLRIYFLYLSIFDE